MANAPSNRAYAAAHFALELDKKDEVGLFRSLEGGGVKAKEHEHHDADGGRGPLHGSTRDREEGGL